MHTQSLPEEEELYFSTLCATVMFFSTRGCLAFFKVSGREGFTIPEAPTSRQNEWAKSQKPKELAKQIGEVGRIRPPIWGGGGVAHGSSAASGMSANETD